MTCRSRRAFTLLEMMMVIIIIGLLVSLVVPAISEARRAFWGVQCLSNIRQIRMAMVKFGTEKPLAANVWDEPAEKRWIFITKYDDGVDWRLTNQHMQGQLVSALELNRKIFLCPAFQADTDVGGDKVICHYAIPTILSGMPIQKLKSAFYRTADGTDIKLPDVPLVVEPQVHAVRDSDGNITSIANSLGEFDYANTKLWTALPDGAFEGGDKLDSRRHSRKFHFGYRDRAAGAFQFEDQPIDEINAENIYFILDDGKVVNCGNQNKYGSWMK